MKENTQHLLFLLNNRLQAEQNAFEKECLPDHVRLCKSRWYSSYRQQIGICRKIAAIKLAIDVLKKPFREIDISEAVMMTISDRNSELKTILMEKAVSIYLNERKEACREIFKQYLPVLKKQVLSFLD